MTNMICIIRFLQTRRMVFPNGFVYETPIDHVLIKDSSELKKSINAKLLR